ncbi:L-rhamnose mutarotase [Microbacterium sp. PM5]|uniref:L-rhamnose mutarotase n=1 Tax=Microbacterium sp. PM5 TaxID=2014534 RepID=UPI000DD116D9|nr:L-rhamnose mutarotase [Microbacterium sp. PM5]AXA96788.1 L-rhamnose 1-epimerase [Microbacterium sp. PM5]
MSSTPVRRFGMAARLVPEKRAEYLELHAAVWPHVEEMNTRCGIRNFTIFVLDDVILGYYEYVGDDYESDQAIMAQDPICQQWWSYTAPCQLPLRSGSPSPNWEQFAEVWHQD